MFNFFVLYLQPGESYKEWQQENKICYFRHQKNLTYFSYYTQENCLLECKINKISVNCGCLPWFIPRKDKSFIKDADNSGANLLESLDTCDEIGNDCFNEMVKNYRDEQRDIDGCDCKNNCEIVHTFTTLQREPFSINMHERDALFNSESLSGLLSNYLLDPKRLFINQSCVNLSQSLNNLTDAKQLGGHHKLHIFHSN